ncbi:MAG: hypothetical protein ACRDRO_21190, partial [Pseudonocardiaceae bacterium]
MTVQNLKSTTAVVIAGLGILGVSAFSYVGSSPTSSRAVVAPVADIATATPLAASSAPLLADGGNGGNGGNGGDCSFNG